MFVPVGCWAFNVGASRMSGFNADANWMLNFSRK